MSEPASRDDIESAKLALLAAIESGRLIHSAEHGSIITRVDDQNTLTRAHIGSEVATVRADVAHTKNYMARVLNAIKRFMTRMGMGTDDL